MKINQIDPTSFSDRRSSFIMDLYGPTLMNIAFNMIDAETNNHKIILS